MRVIVTGSTGNLGSKLVDHLVAADWCDGVIGIDNRPPVSPRTAAKLVDITADLANPTDTRWRSVIAGNDAIVHFATRNPMPDCSWAEATESLAMTSSLLDAALAGGLSRFVFASSNHVMGGYKDAPLWRNDPPGWLTPDLPAAPGTRTTREGISRRPYAYGTSKLYGEALALAKTRPAKGMTAVSVRIGWCQPGENDPSSINALAVPLPPAEAAAAGKANPHDLAWFRGMWLSNRDFVAVMESAIRADAANWLEPAIVVNGMSANRGSVWDREAGLRLIGYEARDDWTRVIKQ
jgi:nucleoside-diphosphate-sugar epimerase